MRQPRFTWPQIPDIEITPPDVTLSDDKVALAALVLSLSLAFWELLKFRREGAWVRVTLRPGFLSAGVITTGPPAGLHPKQPGGLPRGDRFSVEAAHIFIENRGRTAVTVSNVGFDLGRTKWRSRHRHTFTVSPIPFGGYSTANKVRLEPFDEVRFVFDWSQIRGGWEAKGHTEHVVRANVEVAGKGQRRSSRRQRWRFSNGDFRLAPFEKADVVRDLFRQVVHTVRGNPFGNSLATEAAVAAAELLAKNNAVPLEDLVAALEQPFADFEEEGEIAVAILGSPFTAAGVEYLSRSGAWLGEPGDVWRVLLNRKRERRAARQSRLAGDSQSPAPKCDIGD